MFATLLMLYRNYEKRAGLNTQGRLHQQPRKDPVNRLNYTDIILFHKLHSSSLRPLCMTAGNTVHTAIPIY
jgi:hypothetical protein